MVRNVAATIDSAADAAPVNWVLVAAHNEADRIASTLSALAGAFPRAALVVADDGSRDGTAQIARALGARVVASGTRRGKGAAMGAAAAGVLSQCDSGADGLIVLCDGDLGASAAQLGALPALVARGEADLAVAAFARTLGGGFGLTRGFARWAVRNRCGLELAAPISGQRAPAASRLAGLLPFADGYGMELGMTLDAAAAGMRVRELTLALSHRATARTPAGFAHRGAQLRDIVRAYRARAHTYAASA